MNPPGTKMGVEDIQGGVRPDGGQDPVDEVDRPEALVTEALLLAELGEQVNEV